MKTREEVLTFAQSFPDSYIDYPFHDANWACARIRGNKKMFACIYQREGRIWINVKCDPQWRDLWRETFPAVVPAYHMNKGHWNSIILDGSIPEAEIHRMIAESYDLCRSRKK